MEGDSGLEGNERERTMGKRRDIVVASREPKVHPRITGVPEHLQSDAKRLIDLLKQVEGQPDTYTDKAHNDLHRKSRRLLQDLMGMDY